MRKQRWRRRDPGKCWVYAEAKMADEQRKPIQLLDFDSLRTRSTTREGTGTQLCHFCIKTYQ
jgi:hypothetical protein